MKAFCPACQRKVGVNRHMRLKRHKYRRGTYPVRLGPAGRNMCLYSGGKLQTAWQAAASMASGVTSLAHAMYWAWRS